MCQLFLSFFFSKGWWSKADCTIYWTDALAMPYGEAKPAREAMSSPYARIAVCMAS